MWIFWVVDYFDCGRYFGVVDFVVDWFFVLVDVVCVGVVGEFGGVVGFCVFELVVVVVLVGKCVVELKLSELECVSVKENGLFLVGWKSFFLMFCE